MKFAKRRMRLIHLLFAWGLFGVLNGQSLRGVVKSLEKQEFDRATEILEKSLEKEPRNPGAKYYKSVIFIDRAFSGYDVDSAYYFINQALVDYETADEKALQRLTRDEISESTLADQKSVIEGLGFDLALESNTIKAYDSYAERFPSAMHVEQGLANRNQIAFDIAESTNTFQGYLTFIQTYPNAKQISEAKTRYESLLFKDQTKDGKLATLVRFLEDYPQTPYRNQAEEVIYRIQTAGHRIEDYEGFLERYPGSGLQKQAVDMLYHLYKEERSLDMFAHTGLSNDSIDQTIELEKEALITITEDGKYGFINTFGDVVLAPLLTKVPKDYQCKLVSTDVLILDSNDEGLVTYARNGSVANNQGFESALDLGAGLLKVVKNGKSGVIHKSGFEILPTAYADIELVGGRFLKVRKDQRWGLRSVTDLEILGIEFENIESLGEFITVGKNGRVAVTNREKLRRGADQNPIELEFNYDEVELLREKFLLGFNGDKEALLDTDLTQRIEESVQEIIDLDRFWIVKRQEKFYLYGADFNLLVEEPYDEILSNDKWLALNKAGAWALQHQSDKFAPQFKYTLVKLPSEEISLVYDENGSYARFGRGDSLITNDLSIQIIKPSDPEIKDHLLTIDTKGVKRLYGPMGRKILGGRFDNLTVLTQNLFIIDENGRKGLSDSTGRNVLPINNDAIGDFFSGSVSVLRGGKFGLFDYPSRKIIDPEYGSQLRPYAKGLFIATKDDQHGLVNVDNQQVLEFKYDEIAYWKDTIAMARTGDLWQFVNLNGNPGDTTAFSIEEFVHNQDSAKTMIYTGPLGVGVRSNHLGEIIEAGFDDIYLIKDIEPIYYAIKSIPQADFYVVVYFGMEGNHFWRQALTKAEFDKIKCRK